MTKRKEQKWILVKAQTSEKGMTERDLVSVLTLRHGLVALDLPIVSALHDLEYAAAYVVSDYEPEVLQDDNQPMRELIAAHRKLRAVRKRLARKARQS